VTTPAPRPCVRTPTSPPAGPERPAETPLRTAVGSRTEELRLEPGWSCGRHWSCQLPACPCRRNDRFCDGRPSPAINRPAGCLEPMSTINVAQPTLSQGSATTAARERPPSHARVRTADQQPRVQVDALTAAAPLVTALGVPSSHTRLVPRLSGGRAAQAPCPYGFSAGRLDWSACCPLPLPPAAGRSDRLRQRGPRPARLLARRRVWVLGPHHAASHVLTSARLANRHVMVAARIAAWMSTLTPTLAAKIACGRPYGRRWNGDGHGRRCRGRTI
jgi:hypothetical protein